MPYRCTICRKLTNNEADTKCKKEGQFCNLKRVGVVHFLHRDGTGKVMSTGRAEVVKEDADKSKNLQPRYETVDLKLCCNTRADRPQMTDVRSAVTCLTCLANVPAPEKDEDDMQGLDTPTPKEQTHQAMPDPTNDPENANLSTDPTYTVPDTDVITDSELLENSEKPGDWKTE